MKTPDAIKKAPNSAACGVVASSSKTCASTACDAKALAPNVSTPKAPAVVFIQGGLGNVKGIRCAGVSAGFRKNIQRKDLALIVADNPAATAAVFTKNTFCAAPVLLSKQHLEAVRSGSFGTGVKAIVLNSGNANASTGEPGMQTAKQTTVIAADQLGCLPEQILVASTGVIGVPQSIAPFEAGILQALAQLGASDGTALSAGLDAAMAIMTTDTYAKEAAVKVSLALSNGNEATYTIAGMVKGSGMISPNMATMLGVLATDAPLSQAAIDLALRQAVNVTLNKVTVDSDTSTNDSVFLMSSGAAGGDMIDVQSDQYKDFVRALTALCEYLSRQIAYDGEGATKLVTVHVTGAESQEDADLAARSVANSPLVKTAIAGHDANWGRIAMAIGKSGASFKQEQVGISIMGLPVCEKGLPLIFNEDEALRLFNQEIEIVIDIDLGAGKEKTTVWTCDMTHDYIAINGDYRT